MSRTVDVLADGGLDVGTKDFDFVSWVPALRHSMWGLAITKITFMIWLTVALIIVFFLAAYRRPRIVPTRTSRFPPSSRWSATSCSSTSASADTGW